MSGVMSLQNPDDVFNKTLLVYRGVTTKKNCLGYSTSNELIPIVIPALVSVPALYQHKAVILRIVQDWQKAQKHDYLWRWTALMGLLDGLYLGGFPDDVRAEIHFLHAVVATHVKRCAIPFAGGEV